MQEPSGDKRGTGETKDNGDSKTKGDVKDLGDADIKDLDRLPKDKIKDLG
jgi:hypothetical protein